MLHARKSEEKFRKTNFCCVSKDVLMIRSFFTSGSVPAPVGGCLLNEEMRPSEDVVGAPLSVHLPRQAPGVHLFGPLWKSLCWLGSCTKHPKSFPTDAALCLPGPLCSS